MRDRILGIGILALSITYLYLTYTLPVEDIGDPIGPQLFPYLIGVGLSLTGIFVFIEGLKKQDDSLELGEQHIPSRPLAIMGVMVWIGMYFTVFELFGFAISCSLFLLGMMSVFNRGHLRTNAIVSVTFSFSIYVIFTQLLEVKLAPGPLFY
jgi:putative tricarboxylic transport membrane protein